MTAAFFDTDTPECTNAGLKADLLAMIRDHNDATPRHQQTELGPSQVAHPCNRKLAYGLTQTPRCNPPFDPLPSIIGTATHTWLQSAAHHANNQLGRQRWLTETPVTITPGLSGSADLYDTDTNTVIDHKLPGTNRIAAYKRDPGATYRTQVHLYGKGFRNAGHPVQTVAIWFLPRGGSLSGAHLWSEPYDEALALETIARRDQVICLLNDFRVEDNPERYEWFSRCGPDCQFCPWWSPKPQGPLQCPGESE